MKPTTILKSFLLFSAIYLLLPVLGLDSISWYLKPLLLPFLIIAVIKAEAFDSKKILLTALFFSWIGDIILMFADKGEGYFIFGLLSFLLSHLTYIFLFNRQEKHQVAINKFRIAMGTVIIIGYFVGIVLFLLPKLGPLKIPVVFYAVVITSMLFMAFKNSLQWTNPAAKYILYGALAFVLSDSILAINKFYEALPYSNFLIMSTYILAQYGIVSGILLLNKKIAQLSE